jgi:hypothetical protein
MTINVMLQDESFTLWFCQFSLSTKKWRGGQVFSTAMAWPASGFDQLQHCILCVLVAGATRHQLIEGLARVNRQRRTERISQTTAVLNELGNQDDQLREQDSLRKWRMCR